MATFWLHVYCNFWQFANIGNSLHTGFPIGDVNQKLPFLEICQFWQLITHCFPIGDHVNQKLPFLEICQFWQLITHCFPIGDHVNQKLPFLEICHFWQLITHCFPIGDHVNQKLPFLEFCHFWQLITHHGPIPSFWPKEICLSVTLGPPHQTLKVFFHKYRDVKILIIYNCKQCMHYSIINNVVYCILSVHSLLLKNFTINSIIVILPGEWADALRDCIRVIYVSCDLDPETWVQIEEESPTLTPVEKASTPLVSPLPKTPKTSICVQVVGNQLPIVSPLPKTPKRSMCDQKKSCHKRTVKGNRKTSYLRP